MTDLPEPIRQRLAEIAERRVQLATTNNLDRERVAELESRIAARCTEDERLAYEGHVIEMVVSAYQAELDPVEMFDLDEFADEEIAEVEEPVAQEAAAPNSSSAAEDIARKGHAATSALLRSPEPPVYKKDLIIQVLTTQGPLKAKEIQRAIGSDKPVSGHLTNLARDGVVKHQGTQWSVAR